MKKLLTLLLGLLMVIQPTIQFRRMSAEDFSIFLELITKEYAEALNINKYNHFSLQEAQQYAHQQINNFLSQGIHTPRHCLRDIILVTDHGEQAIGFIWYEPHAPHASDHTTWLHYIYIHEDQRGKGYGHAALEELEKEVKITGDHSIALSVFGNNIRAQQLYSSAGYQVVEEKRTDEHTISYWKMSKIII